MTPDRSEPMPDDDLENGVLSHTESIDTSGLGILGGATEQVSVELSLHSEDDDFVDDDVVDDEVPMESVEAHLDEDPHVVHDESSDDDIEAYTGEIEVEHGEPHNERAADEVIAVEVADESMPAETEIDQIDAFDALVRGGIAASDQAAAAAAEAPAPAPVSAPAPVAAAAPAAPVAEAPAQTAPAAFPVTQPAPAPAAATP